MATKKKLLEAAAGAAGGAALNVEEVFSTYLYTGNGSTQTITNDIDLSGEGGLVWFKARSGTYGTSQHALFDTDRGVLQGLASSLTSAEATEAGSLTSFNSNGFDLGSWGGVNGSGSPYASWTFRKAPKFFTCVTYSGTGSAQNISHDLGSDVGFMVVKRTDTTGHWIAWHKDFASTADGRLLLNTTDAYNTSSTYWNSTAPTSTGFTVGTNVNTNASGGTYVAYLFAHNNGDGDFGSTADQDIIRCGSYSGDGTSNGTNVVTLGWEPQWLLIKNTTSADSWVVMDNMRGLVNGGGAVGADGVLFPDTSGSEAGWDLAHPTATGFTFTSAGGNVNQSGQTYIYIAIRRGPMAVPTSATDVFAIDTRYSAGANPAWRSGFPVDMSIQKGVDNAFIGPVVMDRLRGGKGLFTSSTSAEDTRDNFNDYNIGFGEATSADSNFYSWMWKRAPSFFDVVAYTGTGATRTINHNLGVEPEMIWFKKRSGADSWPVYLQSVGNTAVAMYLDGAYGAPISTNIAWFNNTSPTASEITLGYGGAVNESGQTFVAYLFASLDGVSKVGSYTGNGTSQTIDCGFSSGARFILIKRTDTNGDWWVLDTERGIVAGNDALLNLNTTAAEVTSVDVIDPNSSGFTVDTTNGDFNASGGSYIFYAIA